MENNLVETIAQVLSALATAIAAIYAARSAMSASRSAEEMQRARELSSAPLLTITPIHAPIGYQLDLNNGLSGVGRGDELVLENHGNGPATNLAIHFELERTAAAPSSEVVVAEGLRNVMRDNTVLSELEKHSTCYVSNEGVRWDPDRFNSHTQAGISAESYLVSLAKGEGEKLSIPRTLITRWFIDAVASNQRDGGARPAISHLNVSVTFDSMLRRAQQQHFRFQLNPRPFPELPARRESFGSGPVVYEFTLEPVQTIQRANT